MTDNPYYFRVPFGFSGDRSAIPVTDSAPGPISYTYGYGLDYSLPRGSNPSALTIPRESFNQLMYAMSANIQQYQQYAFPWFISSAANGGSPFSYSKNAIVRYDNGSTEENYLSLVNTNTALPTDNTKWLQLRTDPAYLGVAQTFTAIQTISVAGTPLVLNSTDSAGRKITLQDAGVARGGIGATSAYVAAAYLADLTTIAGGWDTSGHLLPGAAATYDLGSTGAQYRNVLANRITVLGVTAPTNGLYLPAASTVGISCNSADALRLTNPGSAVNYLQISGSAAFGNLSLSAVGTDSYIGIDYLSKAAGSHNFYTGGGLQAVIDNAASAVNYFNIKGSATTAALSLSAVGSDPNVGINIASKGTGSIVLLSGSATIASLSSPASAVNYLLFSGSVTTAGVVIGTAGSDTNIPMVFYSKGTGALNFYTNATAQQQFQIAHTASAVNFLSVTGSATGNAASIGIVGTDTNIDMALTPKGTGNLKFGTYTAGAVVQAGYITIKDSGGTTRRLLVG